MDELYKSVLSYSLFEGVDSDLIKDVFESEEVYASEFKDKELIFYTGSNRKYLAVLLSGAAYVYTLHAGQKVILNHIKAPAIIGVASLFGNSSGYVTDIISSGKCKIIFIPETACMKLLKSSNEFAVNYIKFLSDKIRFLNKKISSYTAPDVESKVAEYIVENELKNSTNMSKLAMSLNVSRASLYRIISKFEELGYIKRIGRKIEIIDIDSLNKLIFKSSDNKRLI